MRLYFFIILVIFSESCFSDLSEQVPDRRKSQFETEPGYALFPFPYSLPGIGAGISLVGGASNLANTHMDLYGLLLTGGVKGAAIGLDDIHLIKKRLLVEIGASSLSKATITNYNQRGMRTDKDDFSLIEISNTGSIGTRWTATYFDRRFEIYGAYYRFWSRLERILDNEGNTIIDIEDPSTENADQKIAGIRFDFTDDFQDPRRGVRIDVSGWYNPKEQNGPEYLLLDFNTTGYIPLGKRSTWVFNYFHSDATVFSEGETDRTQVADELGLDCTTVSEANDKLRCNQLIDTVVISNKYGTASTLGGFSRLRSYPQGRYSGAHSRFWGTELRWNLTDEFTPFNLYVIRDVRTAIQVSFFYEIGTIAEQVSKLYEVTRSSYGLGFRIVTASGAVFRGDFAYGNEGFQPNVFIGYPWEI